MSIKRRDFLKLSTAAACLGATSSAEAMESVDYDEDLDDILDTIKEVKRGDLEAEQASKNVMKEKKEEEKE